MIGIQITELKDFMGKLLKSDCFNSFLLEEANITGAATYHIDGRINKDFFLADDPAYTALAHYEFMPWNQISPFCFDLIKGKRTPLGFKFVLHYMPEHLDALLAAHAELTDNIQTSLPPSQSMSVKAAVLTIKYNGTAITITTGISYLTFVLDQTADKLWDSHVISFLEQKGIAYSLK